ncbi:MAG: M20/M25/M40 family metallo-hydrolase [Bryobacterales bacterium]|nr:M20/M25/M40 family metallo-hydrolase [Bryobacterales bacterium]
MRLFLASLLALPAFGQDIAGPRIRAHVKFLSSDQLEGRGVGVRGGELAAEYLATQLELLGVKPAGDNGAYFQRVPLVGVEPLPSGTLSGAMPGSLLGFRWLDDFVGVTQRQTEIAALDAETVFVGHGITAPEFGWDDYKGIDVRGKVVVLFTGEPPSEDPAFFDGKALTYYGRWTYKYEEATRRGAVGCLIVHTAATASYGWDVVRSSWGREDMQVALSNGAEAMAFAGWITEQKGDEMFRSMGKTAAEMLSAADREGFQASALPIRLRGSFPAKVRRVETRNVVGIVPAGSNQPNTEAIVFTAHYDHLGIDRSKPGDGIYNGAVDNATGCAMVLELARAWQALEQKPRRAAVFVFVTAEENGLRGSQYYAANPTAPVKKMVLNLNLDSFYPFGRVSDVVVTGAGRTPYWKIVQNVTQRFRMTIQPDPRPEAGSYFRSDHFSFAKAGVPAFSINMGNRVAGKSEDEGPKLMRGYSASHYHQPSDEYKPEWDFAGMEEMARYAFAIGMDAANQ